jgi:hypothetical protein
MKRSRFAERYCARPEHRVQPGKFNSRRRRVPLTPCVGVSRNRNAYREPPACCRLKLRMTQLIFSNPGRGLRRIIIDVQQRQNASIDVEVTQDGPPYPRSYPARMETSGSLVLES